jgi:hypothetical protein
LGLKDYEMATVIMAEYPDLADFVGPRPETLILAAEKMLEVSFPPIYRRFLSEFGAGNFGPFEIYGVIHSDFWQSGVPDSIWYTLTERRDAGIPNRLVVIGGVGDGSLFCLDLDAMNNEGESPVVMIEPGLNPAHGRQWETVASDFGSFLLEEVQRQVTRG